jgi:hypothetical protein
LTSSAWICSIRAWARSVTEIDRKFFGGIDLTVTLTYATLLVNTAMVPPGSNFR